MKVEIRLMQHKYYDKSLLFIGLHTMYKNSVVGYKFGDVISMEDYYNILKK